MKSLLTPGICLAAVAVLLHTGLVTPSVSLITYAFYTAAIAGLLLAWRFHSSRIFFALLVVFLAQEAISYFSSLVPPGLSASGSFTSGHVPAGSPGSIALAAVGLLLPLNFVLLSLHRERGFSFSSIAPPTLLLFVQSVFVGVLCRPQPLGGGARAAPSCAADFVAVRHAAGFRGRGGVVADAVSAVAQTRGERAAMGAGRLLSRALFWRRGTDPYRVFRSRGVHPGGRSRGDVLSARLSRRTHALPSRRAFHDALLRLQPPYSIAMVDIDHFKRCNDTYGHDTGDQVLRMVASRLARVSGGGQAYRCGGEEFAILFPGKSTADIMEHLEKLRAEIEASSLRLRGPERRQEARGPDRRNQRARGRVQTGDAIRQLARTTPSDELSVTASIGVASSRGGNPAAEEVIQAADRALYRAKGAGRNRVETASSSRRRVRNKAAGIA